jgi:hypothetical protein
MLKLKITKAENEEKLKNDKFYLEPVLTPKFGKVRSLTCGSNAVRNPSGRRKVSSEEFGKRVCGRQFASVRQENCCADFAGLRDDVARAEGTNGWAIAFRDKLGIKSIRSHAMTGYKYRP